jgi:2-polyprenyl-3-methyl-5-hydroxy-6-metoxy-1,4-benzoquinol methylase
MPLPAQPHTGDAVESRPRRSPRKRIAIGGATLAVLVLLVVVAGIAVSNWRGSGFHADGPELPQLRNVLALTPGMSVADVGAGDGDLTMVLAAEVGAGGRVYATDLDIESLQRVRASAAAAGLANITLVQSEASDSKLPANCCDVIVVRRVYHHLTDPAAINASLLRALRPGGVLAVIDFPPMLSWLWPFDHGVDARRVVEEAVASGFHLKQLIEDWPGRGPLASYCAVFSKP